MNYISKFGQGAQLNDVFQVHLNAFQTYSLLIEYMENMGGAKIILNKETSPGTYNVLPARNYAYAEDIGSSLFQVLLVRECPTGYTRSQKNLSE